ASVGASTASALGDPAPMQSKPKSTARHAPPTSSSTTRSTPTGSTGLFPARQRRTVTAPLVRFSRVTNAACGGDEMAYAVALVDPVGVDLVVEEEVGGAW